MSRLTDTLSTYEDFELAFVVKYKLDSYMKETRLKVIEYIKSRELASEDIKSLIIEYESKQFDDNKERCPRCKSLKVGVESVDFYNTNSQSISIYDGIKKDKITCLVCGFLIENPNNEEWKRQVEKSFWNKLITRIKLKLIIELSILPKGILLSILSIIVLFSGFYLADTISEVFVSTENGGMDLFVELLNFKVFGAFVILMLCVYQIRIIRKKQKNTNI